MNHLNVAIVSECADKDLAEKFRADLSYRKYQVTLFDELSCPQEEMAISFLFSLASKYDLVFFLISDNSDYLRSIYKQLKLQKKFSNFKNIYPVYFIG